MGAKLLVSEMIVPMKLLKGLRVRVRGWQAASAPSPRAMDNPAFRSHLTHHFVFEQSLSSTHQSVPSNLPLVIIFTEQSGDQVAIISIVDLRSI